MLNSANQTAASVSGSTVFTSPNVIAGTSVTTTNTGDAGKTAVVAVTTFATAIIAMMM